MEKTYTISVTYEAQITTTATPTEIEEGIWVGDIEIARLGHGGGIIVLANATDIDIQEE
ncbi:MAG: hypothetical protein Unbinned2404contig1000_76 [Prokaryotic dsDNA virus sp.]|nr:MAG: hypothetical protein Unbinned2404contig1000_76 [Prokaryotic dsDNA virus sp.]